MQVCARNVFSESLFLSENIYRSAVLNINQTCHLTTNARWVLACLFWDFWKRKTKRKKRFQNTTLSITCHWLFFLVNSVQLFWVHFVPHPNRFRLEADNMANKCTHILSSSCDSVWTLSHVAYISIIHFERHFQVTWWRTAFSLHILIRTDLHLGILYDNQECIQINYGQSEFCLELYTSSQLFSEL